MKSLCKKIGKILGIMGAFLFSIKNKIYATVKPIITPKDIYIENANSILYGVESPFSERFFISWIKILLVPFIILMGIRTYLKRKDEKKYEKAIKVLKVISTIILIVLLIVIGLYIYLIILQNSY